MADRADRVLIVGADGLVGRALFHALQRRGMPVTGTSRRGAADESRLFLDLSGPEEAWNWPPTTAAAVLCAGITRQEACRQDPLGSARINVHRTVALARRLVDEGAFVVFLSTNQVFDGTVPHRPGGDQTCPLTEYGRQKADSERQLLALGGQVAVVRFTKILGPCPPLLQGWQDSLRHGEVIRPFADMVMAPVGLGFSAEVLRRVVSLRSSGILQVSAQEDLSYAQVGHYLARHLRVDPALVRPVTAAAVGVSPETVPRHTTLDTSRLAGELGLQAPAAWEAMDRALALPASPGEALQPPVRGPEGVALR
jgi:dTDP-4-dehydrorhamnose reductase